MFLFELLLGKDFDYRKDKADSEDWENRKGTMLDEYYLFGEDMTREQVKKIVKEKSCRKPEARRRRGKSR